MNFERIGREMGETIKKADQIIHLYTHLEADHAQLQQRELFLQRKVKCMRMILGAAALLSLLSNICWLLIFIL